MTVRVIFALLLAATMPSLAFAQSPEGPQRDRARTFLVVRIADALNLSDADALKVSTVIRQADEHRQELVTQRQAIEDKLRAVLDKKPPDPAELSKLIGDGNELDRKLALVPEDSFRELQKVLTIEQQAKLMLLRRELQSEIRRTIQSRRGASARRGSRQRGGPAAED